MHASSDTHLYPNQTTAHQAACTAYQCLPAQYGKPGRSLILAINASLTKYKEMGGIAGAIMNSRVIGSHQVRQKFISVPVCIVYCLDNQSIQGQMEMLTNSVRLRPIRNVHESFCLPKMFQFSHEAGIVLGSNITQCGI